MEITKLQLFLAFIKADLRCSPQFTEEQKRKGILGLKLDFPLIGYTSSLRTRLIMITMLRNDIHNLNEEAILQSQVNKLNGNRKM